VARPNVVSIFIPPLSIRLEHLPLPRTLPTKPSLIFVREAHKEGVPSILHYSVLPIRLSTLVFATIGFSITRLHTQGFSTLVIYTIGFSTLRFSIQGFSILGFTTLGFITLGSPL
jgi:hypothetical protein